MKKKKKPTFVIRNKVHRHLYWADKHGWVNKVRATLYFYLQIPKKPPGEVLRVIKGTYRGVKYSQALLTARCGQTWEFKL